MLFTKYRSKLAVLLASALLLPMWVSAQAAPGNPQPQPPPEVPFGEQVRTDVLESMERILTRYAFVPGVDFARWPEMLQRHRERLDQANTENDFVGAVNTALREFGFSHIVLYSPRFAQQRRDNQMVGLGIRIQMEEGGIRVVGLFAEGAAATAGIQVGDLVFEADGRPVTGPQDLQGEENSEVTVRVRRGSGEQQQELSFQVIRKRFSTLIPESLEWLDENTALLRVPTFDNGYNRQNVDTLMAEARKADSIVVDLRGNGGGAVINLLHLSGHFLRQDQPLGTFVGRALVNAFKEETGSETVDIYKVAEWARHKVRPFRRTEQPFAGRVIVLVDGGTGSASEMFSAAMREYRDGKLIGSRTAGAVLASVMAPISHRFLLQYPVTDYVTIRGVRLEGNGLVPEVAAGPARFGDQDPGVQAALEALRG